jgi:replicative DNA helicase
LTPTGVPTGIPELDKRDFGPTRKELWLFIAAAKRGKSWVLIQLAKMAAMHKLKVCHISLEMSQERVALRYMHAFFSLAKRDEHQFITKFERDKLGNLIGFIDKDLSKAAPD